MQTIRMFMAGVKKHLMKSGLDENRAEREAKLIGEQQAVRRMAGNMYDMGIPLDQGPISFYEDAWKTDFWKRQWEQRKAYCEGKQAREAGGDLNLNDNPYRQSRLPVTTRLFELKDSWDQGFNGERW